MANERQNQNREQNPEKPLAGIALSEAQIREAHAKAMADLGAGTTAASGDVCLLATIRLLEHFGWTNQDQRTAAYSWLSQAGHGLGCNASGLAQFVARKNTEKEIKRASVKC